MAEEGFNSHLTLQYVKEEKGYWNEKAFRGNDQPV